MMKTGTLLKNLKARRCQCYDEQFAPRRKCNPYSEFGRRVCRANGTEGGKRDWSGVSEERIAGTLVARNVFLGTPAGEPVSRCAHSRTRLRCQNENLVLVGKNGVGKNDGGGSCEALQNGYRCQFIRAQDLFDEMYASLADRSTRRLLNRLARLDVLLTDEFGYLNFKPEQSNTFFKLMEERYHRHSTIITTNLVYDEWHNFLGNKPMVDGYSAACAYCQTVTSTPIASELQG